MDRYIVISSDCHAGLPGDRYRGYLDPQYREIFDQALPMQVAKIKAAEKSFLIQEINDQWRSGIEQQLTGIDHLRGVTPHLHYAPGGSVIRDPHQQIRTARRT